MNLKKVLALAFYLTFLNYNVMSMTKAKIDGLNGPSEPFHNMHILVEPDVYVLYWSLNDTDAIFEVHVKGGYFNFTNIDSRSIEFHHFYFKFFKAQWFGFGFSLDG